MRGLGCIPYGVTGSVPPYSQGRKGALDPESQGLLTAVTGESTMSTSRLLSASVSLQVKEGRDEGLSSPFQL